MREWSICFRSSRAWNSDIPGEFAQSAVFGLLGAAVVGVLIIGLDFAQTVGRVCAPDEWCFAPGEVGVMIAAVSGIPLAIMAGAGFGLAIWATRRRDLHGRLWIGFVAAALLFALAHLPWLLELRETAGGL